MTGMHTVSQHKYRFRGVLFEQGLKVPLTHIELKSLYVRRSKSTGRWEILSRVSLRRFAEASDYIDSLYARGLAENTIYNECLAIRRFAEDIAVAGGNPLHPGRSHYEDYMAVVGSENAGSSTTVERGRIHRFLMYLRSRGILPQLPYDTRIVAPRLGNGFQQGEVPIARRRTSGKKRRHILPSHSKIDRLIEALVPEARLPTKISRRVGARISDIQRILEAWPTRKIDCDGVTVVNIVMKGGKIGSLHFDPELAAEITEYRALHEQFLRADGVAWTRLTLSAEVRRAADAVGAPDVTFHTLRHVFASRAFQVLHRDAQSDPRASALDPVLIVQYLLNHASPQTTMDTYLHNFAFEPGDSIPSEEMHAVRSIFKAVPESISRGEVQL